jgi:hypothetical protein
MKRDSSAVMAMGVIVVSMLNTRLVSLPTTLFHNKIEEKPTTSDSSSVLMKKHTMFTAEAPPFFRIQGHKQIEETTTSLVMMRKPHRSQSRKLGHS